MALVIGYNSFVVKTLRVQDLLSGECPPHLRNIEVVGRRMYFHLMYIPFFPMWSVWMIRKDGKEVMAPVEVLAKLHEKEISIGIPWYTFAGPLAALVIGAFYLLSLTGPSDYESDCAEGEVLEDIRWSLYEPVLQEADTANYFLLISIHGNESKIARVLSADANNIRLVIFNSPEYITEQEDLYPWGETVYTPDTFTLSRSQIGLLKPYCHDGFFQGSLNLPDAVNPYRLDGVFRISQPWIISGRSAGDCDEGDYCISLRNFGPPITITKVEPISGEVDWEGAEEGVIPTGEFFKVFGDISAFNRTPQYDLRLYCKDEAGKEYKFRVAGISTDIFVVNETP